MNDKKTIQNNGIIRKLTSSILFRRSLAFLVTIGVCTFLIWVILFSEQKSLKVKEKKTGNSVRPVTVIRVKPETHQTNIQAFGEVVPEWKVAVKSKVDGKILTFSEAFRKGNTVKKGDTLLTVDQTDYRVQLADAMLGLKEAKTKLLVEQKEGKDALEAWKRSGIKNMPTSELVLRKPYLEMAEANLAAARQRVKQAELLMKYTKIRAPFDALIVQRHVSRGGRLFAGDEVGVLYGMNTFVVALHIGKKEWAKLSSDWKGMAVTLIDEGLQHQWTGRLMREGRLFEADSRLRTLFVEIDNPLEQSPPLLPGNFVKAKIPGRSISGLLRVPDSARTRQGMVWYVDSGNVLKSVKAEPVFRDTGHFYFKIAGAGFMDIVVNPNNSFMNGLQVTPVVKEN